MNISDLRIKAVESKRGCPACQFEDSSADDCKAICAQLVQRGLPDCDDKAPSGRTYVYQLDDTDPRQMDLLGKEH